MDRDDGCELVLFIHGMWLHASCWRDWEQEFDRAGYQSLSFRWPGEQATVACTCRIRHPQVTATAQY